MGIINRFNTIRRVNRNIDDTLSNLSADEIDALLYDDSEDALRNAIDSLTADNTSVSDAYATLGVAKTDNIETITAVYKAKIKQYHPDRNSTTTPQEQQFYNRHTTELNNAYNEIMKDKNNGY